MERNKERQLTLHVSRWRWFGDRGLSKTSSPRKLETGNKLNPCQICELYDQNSTVRTGYGYNGKFEKVVFILQDITTNMIGVVFACIGVEFITTAESKQTAAHTMFLIFTSCSRQVIKQIYWMNGCISICSVICLYHCSCVGDIIVHSSMVKCWDDIVVQRKSSSDRCMTL